MNDHAIFQREIITKKRKYIQEMKKISSQVLSHVSDVAHGPLVCTLLESTLFVFKLVIYLICS